MAKVKKTKKSLKRTVTSKESLHAEGLDLKGIESQLNVFFTKSMPSLPENVVEIIVKISPWLALVGVVMSVPALLALFGMSQVATYYRMAGVRMGMSYQISNLIYVGETVLMAMSIQGLFARKLTAWRLMFYAGALSILGSLFSGGLISALIGAFISFYLLFQVRRSYK